MYAIKIEDNWVTYSSLPKHWNNKMPYNAELEGFKKLVVPTISENQKLGGVIDDENGNPIYEIIDLTPEEIREIELSKAKVVNAIQFISQLAFEGITQEAIIAVIDTLPEPNKTIAKTAYNRAQTFDRDNQFISLIGQAFDKTDAELDEIFIKASKITT